MSLGNTLRCHFIACLGVSDAVLIRRSDTRYHRSYLCRIWPVVVPTSCSLQMPDETLNAETVSRVGDAGADRGGDMSVSDDAALTVDTRQCLLFNCSSMWCVLSGEKRQTMNHTNVIIVASLGFAQNCYNFQRGQRPQYAFQKWGHKK